MPDDPFQTSSNFVNPSYATPQQLLQMRMVAQQLMGPDQQQVMRPAQGWSNLANTLVGTLMNQQANQGQRQMLQQGQNAMTGAAQQNPYAAMLLGGGVPQTQMMPQQGGATSAPGQSPPMQSAGVPRGIRNNNPGNIEDGPFAKSVPGYAGSDGRFAIFQTPQAGQMAMDKLLQSYGNRGLNTPQAIASRWAPAGDGGNNPMAYASTVAGQMGVRPNTQLNMSDPNIRASLAAGMTQMENGRQMPQQSNMQQAQPNMRMAQNTPQGGEAAMAHMYMDPNVPDQFKTAVQGGQVPQMISDAAGNTYLYKPGMTQPVLVPGLKQAGAPIDVGPGTFKGGVGTLGALGGPQPQDSPGQPQQSGINQLNPLMDWTRRQAAASKAAESEATKTGEKLAEYKGLGVDANQLAGNLDTLKQLGQKVGYGIGPSIQSWLGEHGIPTAGLSDIQAYQRFIPYVGVLLRPEGSGRLMTQELTQFNQSLGGLMTTPQGREIAIDTLSRIAHYKARVADIANNLNMDPNQRMSTINSLPVPPIDWGRIQQIGGAGASTMPTQGGADPEAMAEARKRGLIK